MNRSINFTNNIIFTEKLNKQLKIIQKSDYSILYISDINIDELHINNNHDVLNSLSSTINGPYLLIELSKNIIQIAVSLYKKYNLFYTFIKGKTIISTDYLSLVKLISCPTLNEQYCLDYICDNDQHYDTTAIQEIKRVPPGYIATWRQSEMHPSLIKIELPPPPVNHFNYLIDNLRYIINRKKIKLFYSGGLDSTYLLVALKKCGVDFRAEHILPFDYDGNSEADIALNIASAFNVDLQLIEPQNEVDMQDDEYFLKPLAIHANSPYEINFFERKPLSFNNDGFNSDIMIITGHGGDEIFLQNPPIYSAYDSLSKLNIIKAYRIARDISQLKGEPFLSVVSATIKNAFNKQPTIPSFVTNNNITKTNKHFLLENFNKNNPNYIHYKRILNTLESLGVQSNNTSNFCYPLLYQGSISFIRQFKCEDMFNSHYDRILCRRELEKHTDNSIAWRHSKRSSSGLVFHALNLWQRNLSTALCEGRIASKGLVNTTAISNIIFNHSNVTLGNELPQLVRLYQLESFLSKMLD